MTGRSACSTTSCRSGVGLGLKLGLRLVCSLPQPGALATPAKLGLVRLRPSCPNPNPNPNLNPSPNPSASPNPNLNPNQARLAMPAKLRVAELRDALAAAGLARAGKKAELVGRP